MKKYLWMLAAAVMIGALKVNLLLSTPMGVNYVVIGFDMEVQPLVTQNAAWPFCVSAICIDVMSNHLHMPRALLA